MMLATLAIAVLLLVGCEEKIRPSVVPVADAAMAAQESWVSTVTLSDSARLKAILWAGHIAVYPEKETTLMDDSVHVDFYSETEQHTSTLTARRGRVNDRTRDFAAYEQVVVISDSGSVLRTDSLFWNSKTSQIETDAYVEIISPTEHIRGHGLVSDQGLKDYRIFRVTGEAVVKE